MGPLRGGLDLCAFMQHRQLWSSFVRVVEKLHWGTGMSSRFKVSLVDLASRQLTLQPEDSRSLSFFFFFRLSRLKSWRKLLLTYAGTRNLTVQSR